MRYNTKKKRAVKSENHMPSILESNETIFVLIYLSGSSTFQYLAL